MNRRITAFAAALLAGLPAADAATETWNIFTAGPNNWNVAGNWLDASQPATGDTTLDVLFPAGLGSANTNNDFAGLFLNSLTFSGGAAETVAISGNSLDMRTDGATTPAITQNGAGAVTISAPVVATNALTLNGGGTGLTTLSGAISGGGLSFTAGNWKLTNVTNSFSGLTVTGGVVEINSGALAIDAPATGTNSYFGSGTVTINGGELKLTTTGTTAATVIGATTLARVFNFGTAGGTLNFNGMDNTAGLNIALANANAATAVIKFSGGAQGINGGFGTTATTWNDDANAIRISTLTGQTAGTPLRIELTNGAELPMVGALLNTVTAPITIRGVIGGDPTATGTERTTGRVSLTAGNTTFSNGLFLEGALQFQCGSAARIFAGNITLNPGAAANFQGRGTGTAVAFPEANAFQFGTAATINVSTLTISSGAIAGMDIRLRTDQNFAHGVQLFDKTNILPGGTLKFTHSWTSTTATNNVGWVDVQGDIVGNGTNASESVIDLKLGPANTTTFSTVNGVTFNNPGATGADLIVNGTGFGGLKVTAGPRIIRTNIAPAAPTYQFGADGSTDPVLNDAKVANLLTGARLAAITGSGGYLTAAPPGKTFAFPLNGEWSGGVSVGLRIIDHNAGGTDVSLGALGSWGHNLAVDSGATLDLGAQNPFFFAGPGTLHGKGSVTGTGSIFVDTGGSFSPGLGDIGTLSIGMPLILSGGLSIGVNNATADTLAVTGALTLGGPLSLNGTYGTNDLTIASYTGTLTGTFSSVSGLSPDFTLNYGSGANSVISLLYTALPTLVWNGSVSANWNTTTANWQGGGVFANGGKVLFDDTAAGPNFNVVVSGGDVSPGLVTVTNNSTPYTLISTGGAAITGSGKLIKNGGGTLTLSGPAAYTGGTDINGGELRLAVANSLPDTGTVTVATGATLNTQGNSDTIGDLTVNGSVTGGGTLTVGALALGSGASVSPNLILGGNVTKTGAAGTTLAGTVNLGGATRTFDVAAGGGTELTLNGVVSNGSITKAGNGTLVLSNAGNSQTTTTVNAGTLNSLGGIPSGSAVAVGSGSTLNLTHGAALNFASLDSSGIVNVTDAQPLAPGSLSGGGGSLNGASGISLTQGTTTAYAGAITGVTSVNMNGTGAITLSGASSYSGGLFANSGRIVVSGSGGGSGILTANTGGKLGIASALTNRVDLSGGTVFALGGPATITSNDLVATAATTTTISNSDPDAPATLSEINVTGTLKGSGNLNLIISTNAPHPDGGVGFRLNGTGASDFSGTITVGQGVKFQTQVGTAGPFSPAGTGRILMVGGNFTGALNGNYSQWNTRNNFTGNTTVGNNVEITGTGFANFNLAGTAPAGAAFTLGNLKIGGGQTAGANKNGATGQIVEFTSVTLTGGNATFSPTTPGFGASGGADISLGPIGEGVAGSGIIMNGSSTLSLLGTNTYTGGTTIQSGTTRLGAPGALPLTTDLTVNGGTLDLSHPVAGSADQIINSLAGTGGTITNTEASLRSLIVNQSTNTTFSGSLTGNLSLDKQNTGTLALAGTNTHTGFTFANVGTLLINGNNGTGTVFVGPDGTLGGTGTTGAVSIATTGTLAPGAGAGILSTGSVSFDPSANFAIELNGPMAGTAYDQLNVTGGVSIGTNTQLSLSLGFDPVDGVDTFTIILNDGVDSVAGNFAGLPNNTVFTTGGQQFAISYFDDSATPDVEFSGGNDVTLQAVPEPCTATLLLGGVNLLAARRRRERKK